MSCTGCNGNACDTLDGINSAALNGAKPWDPQEVAQNVLNIMQALGINTYGMDAYMAIAAMNQQGCYTNPNSCYEYGFPTYCSPMTDKEGYGVLQETYFASQGSLSHATGAYNEATKLNVQNIFFPHGINGCTVISDPGIAFAEFYFWSLTYPGNNCQTVGAWIGGPSCAVSCAECSYTAFTGNAC